jgi:hypothetical protein
LSRGCAHCSKLLQKNNKVFSNVQSTSYSWRHQPPASTPYEPFVPLFFYFLYPKKFFLAVRVSGNQWRTGVSGFSKLRTLGCPSAVQTSEPRSVYLTPCYPILYRAKAWRAGVCWSLLCLCRPFCIFERCLDSNPESCRSKQARYYNLATHLPSYSAPNPRLATHLPLHSHPCP